MARQHVGRDGGLGSLVFGLALMAFAVYRPGWVSAGVTAYAHFWDRVVSPALLSILFKS